MGYAEKNCQLCVVSNNVARLRTKHEPESAGWGYSSATYYSGDELGSICSIFKEQSGCENVERERNGERRDNWIHFPGRGCTFEGGYNGWKIGAEEMKGMNLPRYIIKKPAAAKPEKDETDYEKCSEYFITSQTTCPPCDFEPGELATVRYGVRDFFPQNYDVGVEFEESGWGVPVHDACWKIFERVSRMRNGEVDLDGFMALWFREACGNCGFQNVKHEGIIQKCREQFWVHAAGTEYLGANPHDIPGFLLAIQGVYTNDPEGDGVFRVCKDNKPRHENPNDPFSKLSAELRGMVLSRLSSKDIGSLRLASWSFRQLPKQLFFRLIQDELPWFWEFDELRAVDDSFWGQTYAEDDPGDARNERVKERIQRSREGKFINNVNWLEVYKRLCLLTKGIPGVKNRARVWNVVEEVVARIARLREKGWPQIEPTDEEQETGLVKNSFYCSRCNLNIEGEGS